MSCSCSISTVWGGRTLFSFLCYRYWVALFKKTLRAFRYRANLRKNKRLTRYRVCTIADYSCPLAPSLSQKYEDGRVDGKMGGNPPSTSPLSLYPTYCLAVLPVVELGSTCHYEPPLFKFGYRWDVRFFYFALFAFFLEYCACFYWATSYQQESTIIRKQRECPLLSAAHLCTNQQKGKNRANSSTRLRKSALLTVDIPVPGWIKITY